VLVVIGGWLMEGTAGIKRMRSITSNHFGYICSTFFGMTFHLPPKIKCMFRDHDQESGGLTRRTTYLVVGRGGKPSAAKEAKARGLGVTVLSEAELAHLVRAADPDATRATPGDWPAGR
jgi:NAD-dependent DNA ligase